jgi:hypothetical protein
MISIGQTPWNRRDIDILPRFNRMLEQPELYPVDEFIEWTNKLREETRMVQLERSFQKSLNWEVIIRRFDPFQRWSVMRAMSRISVNHHGFSVANSWACMNIYLAQNEILPSMALIGHAAMLVMKDFSSAELLSIHNDIEPSIEDMNTIQSIKANMTQYLEKHNINLDTFNPWSFVDANQVLGDGVRDTFDTIFEQAALDYGSLQYPASMIAASACLMMCPGVDDDEILLTTGYNACQLGECLEFLNSYSEVSVDTMEKYREVVRKRKAMLEDNAFDNLFDSLGV